MNFDKSIPKPNLQYGDRNNMKRPLMDKFNQQEINEEEDEFYRESSQIPQTTKWSPLATLGIKALAGLGVVVGTLLAIGLLPFTIAGLSILLRSDPKKDFSRLGVVLAFPLMGAIQCLKVIGEF